MVLPVILCGGVGSRLWPLSRTQFPKLFHDLTQSEQTCLQQTIARATRFSDRVFFIAGEDHRFAVKEQSKALGLTSETILLEPCPKNTAPAIALSAFTSLKKGRDDLLLVMPGDHVFAQMQPFEEAVNKAIPLAEQGRFVTFGCVPTCAHTGYGYIRAAQDGVAVDAFIEKPDVDKATAYWHSGDYYWNSGIFLVKASVYLQQLQQHAPEIFDAVERSVTAAVEDGVFIRVPAEYFKACPEDSVDYAILEKTDCAAVIPLQAQWTDLGSWESIYDFCEKDSDGNCLAGDVVAVNSHNTLVHASHRLVAAVDMEDVAIVETRDAVLVVPREKSQHVKQLVNTLHLQQRQEIHFHTRVNRPWGWYESIEQGPGFQVKRIGVKPGASLSLQLHHHRSEHWVVVQGEAEVTCDDKVFTLMQNQSTFIPAKSKHRLVNRTEQTIEIIEVQSGSYLGEDDIVRFDDCYGRATATEETC